MPKMASYDDLLGRNKPYILMRTNMPDTWIFAAHPAVMPLFTKNDQNKKGRENVRLSLWPLAKITMSQPNTRFHLTSLSKSKDSKKTERRQPLAWEHSVHRTPRANCIQMIISRRLYHEFHDNIMFEVTIHHDKACALVMREAWAPMNSAKWG